MLETYDLIVLGSVCLNLGCAPSKRLIGFAKVSATRARGQQPFHRLGFPQYRCVRDVRELWSKIFRSMIASSEPLRERRMQYSHEH
jgi:pyruvate/2-oxoglutarate dehydrogenase complex dihydrolipoamide dehydrogenase (E3) component